MTEPATPSSSSVESTLVFNTTDPKTPLIYVNMAGITKLTTSNYITWKLQVQALLEAHELHCFIDDETQAPSSTIIATNTEKANPLFTPWKRQDRMLYSALLGTLSVGVQPIVARSTTTKDMWNILAQTYGKPSRGHIKQIKQQIKRSTKGTLSIDEYMSSIITKADQLALLGAPLEHEDLLDIITEGLGDDYRPVVEMVNGRDTPITIEELHEKLINRELSVLAAHPIDSMSTPVTANTAQYQHYNSTPRRNFNRGAGTYRGNFQHNNSRGNFRTSRPYLGRCQICDNHGHSARRCPQFAGNNNPQRSGPPSRNSYQPQNVSPQWYPQAHYTDTSPSESASWLLDSGASHHIASDLHNLSLHAPYQGGEDVMIGNGTGLNITHTGSTHLPSQSRSLSLTNVLCVPAMKKNLISVNKLCKTNNVMVQLCPSTFQVKDLSTGVTILNGKANAGVYEWPTTTSSSTFSAFSVLKSSHDLWHSRLGHPSSSTLHKIISEFSLPTISNSSVSICNSCSINKSHKLPFYKTSIISSRPLEIIFSDVWTSPLHSTDGFKYYVIFVDHFTRYTWLYPLKSKSQVSQIFPLFQGLVENRFCTRIKTLYSDNGGEYLGLKGHLASHGITHLTSPPHTPEHNGISERKHRHIVETGLTLLSQASMPKKYWPYAFSTAVYLINRMPTPTLAKSSPHHRLFGTLPNYNKLRIFGCLCYPWIRPYGTTKFSPKSTPCVFIGYSLTQSAFLCLDVSTSRLYTSRHVVFHENSFPFSKNSYDLEHSSPTPILESQNTVSLAPVFRRSLMPASPSAPSPVSESTVPVTEVSFSTTAGNAGAAPDLSTACDQNPPLEVLPLISETDHAQGEQTSAPNFHPMQTRSKDKIFKPNPKYGLAAQLVEIEPKSVTEALKDERWRKAMSTEMDAQIRNGTWELVPPDNGYNIVGCKWVFTIKRHADGSINRFKARLVAKGFHQQSGVDFHETFSPVIKHATIRLVLGVAVGNGWPLRQLDVNNAFLQGNLQENVYMVQPPGFVDKDRPDFVCCLQKALYGLKQAPRAWYTALKSFLLSIGFITSLADASLFILRKGSQCVYVLIYVDDILVTGSCITMVHDIITTMANRFSLKDLGDLSFFLGLEASRTSAGLRLTQQRYITDLLCRTNMENAKPTLTPMSSSEHLTLSSGSILTDPTPYRATIGSLQYLGLTRPDISFAVNRLSQFMHQPTTVHWEAAKRILRYLAGTATHGIFFSSSTPLTLHAFCDADWGGNRDDYTSTGAYIIYLGKQPISWTSRKQKGVARSSTEAEYRAVAMTASELKWFISLSQELGIQLSGIPTIFCDNIGATYLCANPVFHSRMKHLALDYHFVRQMVEDKVLRVSHISSTDQLADALTKPLPRTRFRELSDKIGLSSTRPS